MLASVILRLLAGQPIGFVDIGARGGVHSLIEPMGRAVAVLAFEPDPSESERLRRDQGQSARYAALEIESSALADRSAPAVLYETAAPTNSSLRRANPEFVQRYRMSKWRTVGQTPLATTTLDEVLFVRRARQAHWGEAMKIDVQGSEYEVLLGARRTLEARTLFVCAEISFCELYCGQKLFSEIELLLRGMGFLFYGFDRIFNRSRKSLDKRDHWGRERAIQADAYFFKDPFDRSADAGLQLDARQTAILAGFALLAGYHDFALELLDGLGETGGELRDAIFARARLAAETSRVEARKLVEAIDAHPREANILIGKFVDERRSRNDYFDI